MIKDSRDYLEEAAQIIFDKDGQNIIGIDVREFSNMTEYFLVAEGQVERQVQAMARHVLHTLGNHNVFPLHQEGQKSGDWIVLDYGDFVIHLMCEEMREKYRLEEIWKAGKIVDLKLKVLAKA